MLRHRDANDGITTSFGCWGICMLLAVATLCYTAYRIAELFAPK